MLVRERQSKFCLNWLSCLLLTLHVVCFKNTFTHVPKSFNKIIVVNEKRTTIMFLHLTCGAIIWFSLSNFIYQ